MPGSSPGAPRAPQPSPRAIRSPVAAGSGSRRLLKPACRPDGAPMTLAVWIRDATQPHLFRATLAVMSPTTLAMSARRAMASLRLSIRAGTSWAISERLRVVVNRCRNLEASSGPSGCVRCVGPDAVRCESLAQDVVVDLISSHRPTLGSVSEGSSATGTFHSDQDGPVPDMQVCNGAVA
jgi:hypothetical protein